MNSGLKQRLSGVNVSESCDARLVQEAYFDGSPGRTGSFDQNLRRKGILERFRPQGLQNITIQLEASELTRILEHQRRVPQVEDRGHVSLRCEFTETSPNASGHPKVEQQDPIGPYRTPAQLKHQILPPPPNLPDAMIPNL